MILFAHHFWRHITWSAARFFRIILGPYSCDTKVGDLQIPVLVEDEIFRLYVAVDYQLVMDKTESLDNTGYEKLSLIFVKYSISSYVVS